MMTASKCNAKTIIIDYDITYLYYQSLRGDKYLWLNSQHNNIILG